MTQLQRQRIRLRVDTASFDQMLDVRTEEAPELWRGNDVQFEVGLFRGETLLDVANYVSMTLEVKENTASGLADDPLMTATVTGGIDNTVDDVSWADESAQHALFAFTGIETNLELGTGNTEKTYWLVVSGLTGDSPARRVTFGHALLKIREDGAGAAGSPPVNDPLYYTQAETEALLAGKLAITNNLDDVADASTARTNLGAASAALVGAANGICPLDADAKVALAHLPDTVLGAMQYQGTWNAAANNPDIDGGSPETGDYHVVSTAGSTDLDGITDWQVGDWAVFDGIAWAKIDNSDKVSSVNGKTGAVDLKLEEASDFAAAPSSNGQVPVWDEDTGVWNARALSGDVSLNKLGAASVVKLTPGAPPLAGFARTTSATDIALSATSARTQYLVPNAADIAAILPTLASVQDGWMCDIVHDGASHAVSITAHTTDGGATLAHLYYLESAHVTRVNGAWQVRLTVPVKTAILTADTTLEGETLVRADATASSLTLTMPPAARSVGRRLTTWKTDAGANTVSFAAQAGDTLHNNATLSDQWARAEIVAIAETELIKN